jgi:hypothetical protein
LQINKVEKDRKTERQKDRKTERQKDRKTERQKDRKTERQKDRKTERHLQINKTASSYYVNPNIIFKCLAIILNMYFKYDLLFGQFTFQIKSIIILRSQNDNKIRLNSIPIEL